MLLLLLCRVLVIGGGPTGLGAAIEAERAGHEVVVVEKRPSYERSNVLFLYTSTLELFEEWGVAVPEMEELTFNGERRGVVTISDLEKRLSEKVVRMEGEFLGFGVGKEALIGTKEGVERVAYDLMLGADGANSRVREGLGIGCEVLGESLGGIAIAAGENEEGLIVGTVLPHEKVFAKRIQVPNRTILFFQNLPGQNGSQETDAIRGYAEDLGWGADAVYFENIPLSLQRANRFVDEERGVVLLGDAAASASFWSGTGVNFCFATVKGLRSFLQTTDFQDVQIEEAVEWLISKNAFLFN